MRATVSNIDDLNLFPFANICYEFLMYPARTVMPPCDWNWDPGCYCASTRDWVHVPSLATHVFHDEETQDLRRRLSNDPLTQSLYYWMAMAGHLYKTPEPVAFNLPEITTTGSVCYTFCQNGRCGHAIFGLRFTSGVSTMLLCCTACLHEPSLRFCTS